MHTVAHHMLALITHKNWNKIRNNEHRHLRNSGNTSRAWPNKFFRWRLNCGRQRKRLIIKTCCSHNWRRPNLVTVYGIDPNFCMSCGHKNLIMPFLTTFTFFEMVVTTHTAENRKNLHWGVKIFLYFDICIGRSCTCKVISPSI